MTTRTFQTDNVNLLRKGDLISVLVQGAVGLKNGGSVDLHGPDGKYVGGLIVRPHYRPVYEVHRNIITPKQNDVLTTVEQLDDLPPYSVIAGNYLYRKAGSGRDWLAVGVTSRFTPEGILEAGNVTVLRVGGYR